MRIDSLQNLPREFNNFPRKKKEKIKEIIQTGKYSFDDFIKLNLNKDEIQLLYKQLK